MEPEPEEEEGGADKAAGERALTARAPACSPCPLCGVPSQRRMLRGFGKSAICLSDLAALRGRRRRRRGVGRRRRGGATTGRRARGTRPSGKGGRRTQSRTLSRGRARTRGPRRSAEAPSLPAPAAPPRAQPDDCRLPRPPPRPQIRRAPAQCLRYCYDEGARPLWLSQQGVPDVSSVPACEHCGAKRRARRRAGRALVFTRFSRCCAGLGVSGAKTIARANTAGCSSSRSCPRS